MTAAVWVQGTDAALSMQGTEAGWLQGRGMNRQAGCLLFLATSAVGGDGDGSDVIWSGWGPAWLGCAGTTGAGVSGS